MSVNKRKEYSLSCAHYVLGGRFEYDDLVRVIDECFNEGMNRIEVRQHIKDNHIWFAASCLVNGRKLASKSLTDIIREVRA